MYQVNSDLTFSFSSTDKSADVNSPMQIELQSLVWETWLSSNAPMGRMLSTRLFSMKDDIVLLHLTTSKKEILLSQTLHVSGGGLGGCLYCTPIVNENRLHNLGKYILEYELPMFLRGKSKDIEAIAVVVKKENLSKKNVLKVDYLEWGNRYLEIFESLDTNIIEKVKEDRLFMDELHSINNFMIYLQDLDYLQGISKAEYTTMFNHTLDTCQTSRVVYFETLLEFLFLFQDNAKAHEYLSKGELYNKQVKDLVFKLCPELKDGFSLNKFKPDANYSSELVGQSDLISKSYRKHFMNFMKWRFAHNLRSKVQNGQVITESIHSYADMKNICPSLLGIMLFRLYKKEFKLEAGLADLLIKEWQSKEIFILEYSSLPKGEVGVVPQKRDIFSFHDAKIVDSKLIIGGKLPINFIAELIDPNDTMMRDPAGLKVSV